MPSKQDWLFRFRCGDNKALKVVRILHSMNLDPEMIPIADSPSAVNLSNIEVEALMNQSPNKKFKPAEIAQHFNCDRALAASRLYYLVAHKRARKAGAGLYQAAKRRA